jgi:hypothetical protein
MSDGTTQPDLPIIAAGPVHWEHGIECRYGQLKTVIEAANRAGYRATRVHVIKLGYRVEFMPDATWPQDEAKRHAQADRETGKASVEAVCK